MLEGTVAGSTNPLLTCPSEASDTEALWAALDADPTDTGAKIVLSHIYRELGDESGADALSALACKRQHPSSRYPQAPLWGWYGLVKHEFPDASSAIRWFMEWWRGRSEEQRRFDWEYEEKW